MGLQRLSSSHDSSSSSHDSENLNIPQSSRRHRCKVIFRIPPTNSQCSLENNIRRKQLAKQKEIEAQPLRPANSWVSEPENEKTEILDVFRQFPSEQKARIQLPKLVTQFPEYKEQSRAEPQRLSFSRIFNVISMN